MSVTRRWLEQAASDTSRMAAPRRRLDRDIGRAIVQAFVRRAGNSTRRPGCPAAPGATDTDRMSEGVSTMAISDLLLTEFDEEVKKTRKALERVPSGQGEFAPHTKSMPLGKL